MITQASVNALQQNLSKKEKEFPEFEVLFYGTPLVAIYKEHLENLRKEFNEAKDFLFKIENCSH